MNSKPTISTSPSLVAATPDMYTVDLEQFVKDWLYSKGMMERSDAARYGKDTSFKVTARDLEDLVLAATTSCSEALLSQGSRRSARIG